MPSSSFSTWVRLDRLAVWLLIAGLGVLVTSASGCKAPPEHRHYAEQLREEPQQGPGVDQKELHERDERIGELQGELAALNAEHDLLDGRLREAMTLARGERTQRERLEAQLGELHEQRELLQRQVDALLRREDERQPSVLPSVHRLVAAEVSSDQERPTAPQGYARVDEGGFGFDYPESWHLRVLPSLQYTEFVVTHPQGLAQLRVRMWPYPRWADNREIADVLNVWMYERVNALPGASVVQNPEESEGELRRAGPRIAGAFTPYAELAYTNDEGVPTRQIRAKLNLLEQTSDIYRSFQADFQALAEDVDELDELKNTLFDIVGSFWLPGA